MARSLDGGESWRLKGPKSLLPRSSASPEEINFTHPDFVMQCGGSEFYISYDRGKTWQGAYKFPDFDRGYPLELMARTDYIVNDQDDCLIFLTASKPNGKEGRPFCTRTRDGGKTFDFVSWITPEPPTVGDIRAFSIMPSSVRCSENQIISAIRKHYDRVSWIDVYVSHDNGGSWQFLSRPVSGPANPPSIIRLKDGRICLTYGYRDVPRGIRANISDDNGKTWREEIILRQDGRTWDLGYARTVQRPDGRIVTAYYYTTEDNPEQHIGATIWDVDGKMNHPVFSPCNPL